MMRATREQRIFWSIQMVLAASAIGIFLAISLSDADSHEAQPTAAQPQGWNYPLSCCSGYDCRVVGKPLKVEERPDGYVVPSGEVIAMSDPRIRNSPDGEFHWCTVAGKDDGRTICLFAPPRGF